MLVKRLQESLSRMESFEVTTAFQGLPGEGQSTRSPLTHPSRVTDEPSLSSGSMQTRDEARPLCSLVSFGSS